MLKVMAKRTKKEKKEKWKKPNWYKGEMGKLLIEKERKKRKERDILERIIVV